MRSKLTIFLISIVTIMILIMISCNFGSIGGGNVAIGRVSNDFGNQLNRDIDGDGDNDAAAVFHSIAGGKGDDIGLSLYVDSNGKIYVTGGSWNGRNYDMYVIKIE